ncbi:hypothetical protein BU15DRAFT_65202, partial [Melanogaster broomeanus]
NYPENHFETGVTAAAWFARRVKYERLSNRKGPETWAASRGTEHNPAIAFRCQYYNINFVQRSEYYLYSEHIQSLSQAAHVDCEPLDIRKCACIMMDTKSHCCSYHLRYRFQRWPLKLGTSKDQYYPRSSCVMRHARSWVKLDEPEKEDGPGAESIIARYPEGFTGSSHATNEEKDPRRCAPIAIRNRDITLRPAPDPTVFMQNADDAGAGNVEIEFQTKEYAGRPSGGGDEWTCPSLFSVTECPVVISGRHRKEMFYEGNQPMVDSGPLEENKWTIVEMQSVKPPFNQRKRETFQGAIQTFQSFRQSVDAYICTSITMPHVQDEKNPFERIIALLVGSNQYKNYFVPLEEEVMQVLCRNVGQEDIHYEITVLGGRDLVRSVPENGATMDDHKLLVGNGYVEWKICYSSHFMPIIPKRQPRPKPPPYKRKLKEAQSTQKGLGLGPQAANSAKTLERKQFFAYIEEHPDEAQTDVVNFF